MKELLQTAPELRYGVVDGLSWAADRSGLFTVSSAYKWKSVSGLYANHGNVALRKSGLSVLSWCLKWVSYCARIEKLIKAKIAQSSGCDLFQGSWVFDDTNPLYSSSICPFIEQEFDCQGNGRPDMLYLKHKWKPIGCDLPRYV
ncbi:Protein trichome birefringence-like 43 [Camellia lanceoleosa]|uniref:Protein trichome birefringence-like 43 n=1 Tax=Camellia lanceoleosa TaxID=1840588 RepID=A0ACC0HFA2_9ERIC|nr:Protein trichome birefringence-like 43 [Camellia lanceoleosa]